MVNQMGKSLANMTQKSKIVLRKWSDDLFADTTWFEVVYVMQ